MKRSSRATWQSAGPSRTDNTRLWGMVTLLAVVLVLIVVASRPEIWSNLFPNEQNGAPQKRARPSAEASDQAQQRPDGDRKREAARRNSLMMIALITLTAVYFAWRITRIGRALSSRPRLTRTRHFESRPRPPDSPGTRGVEPRAESDESSELTAIDEPTPASEPSAPRDADPQRQPPGKKNGGEWPA